MPRSKQRGTSDWESILDKVTLKANKDEVLFDPYIIDTLLVAQSPNYLKSLALDPRLAEEKKEQINRLRAIARQKIEGRPRECLLLLLSGCDSYTEIGDQLGFSRDTVRRALEEAAPRLKAHIRTPRCGTFPSAPGHRLKTALFPLDTEEEQKHFQNFLNTHQIVHLALATGPFREILVIYQ